MPDQLPASGGAVSYKVGRYSDDEQKRLFETLRQAGVPSQLKAGVLVVDVTYRRICDHLIQGISPDLWGSHIAVTVARRGAIQDRADASLPSVLRSPGKFAIVDDAVLIGGYSHGLAVERSHKIAFGYEGVVITSNDAPGAPYGRRYEDLIAVNVDGSGAVTTGGRFIGGGFGATGILEGLVVAAVLSKLTERTTIHTYVEIQDQSSHMVFFTDATTPSALKVALKPVWAKMRTVRSANTTSGQGVIERLERLANLRSQGALSEEEFDQLKQQILGDV